jgi:hypothetical protein
MRRIRPRCCPRATTGHAAALPSTAMNALRRILDPPVLDWRRLSWSGLCGNWSPSPFPVLPHRRTVGGSGPAGLIWAMPSRPNVRLLRPVYSARCRGSGPPRTHHHEDHGRAGERNGDGYCRRKPAGPKAGKHDEADDRRNGVLAGHSNSRSRLDLVPCQFERPHDCFRLSHRKESVNASSTFVRVLCQGRSQFEWLLVEHQWP